MSKKEKSQKKLKLWHSTETVAPEFTRRISHSVTKKIWDLQFIIRKVIKIPNDALVTVLQKRYEISSLS
jgi:hypothetical protein